MPIDPIRSVSGAPNKTMDHARHDDVAWRRRMHGREDGKEEDITWGGYVTCLLLEAKVVCNPSEASDGAHGKAPPSAVSHGRPHAAG